jgi:ABC-type nickel/cobalt efflux system permease component RcnA
MTGGRKTLAGMALFLVAPALAWAGPFDGASSSARPGLGGLTPFIDTLTSLQRGLNSFLGDSLIQASEGFQPGAFLLTLAVAIAYGIIHALSPGHGKTMLLAYGLKNEKINRAVLLAPGIGAMLHVLSALIWTSLFTVVISQLFGLGKAQIASALLVFASVILLGNGLKDVVQLARKRPDHHHDWIWVALSIGLVPCPISTVIFTAAIQYAVPVYGAVVCLVFGLGLAISLILFGLLPVLARKPFTRFFNSSQGMVILRWIPLATAAAFIVLGVAGIVQVALGA